MFNKNFSALLATAALLAVSSQAGAATIFDTGAPDLIGTYYSIDGVDSLAGEISVGPGQNLTGIRSYLTGGDIGSAITLALYSDTVVNGHHTAGSELFSGDTTFQGDGWTGLSGLNWSVAAGNYWVGVETRDGSFIGFAPGTTSGDSFVHTAFADGSHNGAYQASDGINFGLQVDAVPEPESYAMLLAGLGLITFVARRRA